MLIKTKTLNKSYALVAFLINGLYLGSVKNQSYNVVTVLVLLSWICFNLICTLSMHALIAVYLFVSIIQAVYLKVHVLK